LVSKVIRPLIGLWIIAMIFIRNQMLPVLLPTAPNVQPNAITQTSAALANP
jgi:hypothetical protein